MKGHLSRKICDRRLTDTHSFQTWNKDGLFSWYYVFSDDAYYVFFNPSPTSSIKFVKFPKDIDVAKQERFFGHIFSQHDRFTFADIKFTSGLNQNTE